MQKNINLFTSISVTAMSVAIAAESHAATTFTFDQVGIFNAMIDTSGVYDIRVRGANGGDSRGTASGGIGALIGGSYYLSAGTPFSVLVGGVGASNSNGGAGGGGGMSYLNFRGDAIEVVAGGGGGASGFGILDFGVDGGDGRAVTSGGSGDFPSLSRRTGGVNGFGGSGATDSEGDPSGGGAGVLGSAMPSGLGSPRGGLSAPTFLGGVAGSFRSGGGLGGGGAGSFFSGGGGGGYSGGSAGYLDYGGGGGGSYLSSMISNRQLIEGNSTDYLGLDGSGFVSLELQPVPVPGGILLFASAMTALFAAQRKKS